MKHAARPTEDDPTGPRPLPTASERPGVSRPLLFSAACLLLLAATAALLAVHDWVPLGPERAAHAWSVAHRPDAVAAAAVVVTAAGSGPVLYALALLAGALAGRNARERLRAALIALSVLLLGQAVRYVLMELIARPRPSEADWISRATGHSFPSGHSTTSVLVAGLLARAVLTRLQGAVARRLACALLAVWAVTVGATRVYLGVHWPGDVLAGWLLATAWLSCALHLVRRGTLPFPPASPPSGAPQATH
ncbi:phosphatase PAP2 family protein [Streptomyces albofaciens JCM 4342]|uniref:phosphatase PAP2 family protein n=1 Tax=Streptomyces albofaciens TaxID=66866 RepID=UPI00123A4785|nr:phosphatase PAP2 family protein [Streptomyces albofaciens]KAA6213866.1 phosphatase PAP2 family protein [Streptomyces albofaciens JCM 4342]